MTFTDFVCLFLVVQGRAPGRTGRQAVAGREAGRAEAGGDRTAEPGPRTQKRCGPARMRQPTAVWSKHQS